MSKKQPDTLEVCRRSLFATKDELAALYTEAMVLRVLRIRDLYAWVIANPDAKDRQFVEEHLYRYRLSKFTAYSDLAIIKQLLPSLSAASRDWHRWRSNEMFLETYSMAKKRKDTRTMERAASAYAKYNRVDIEDEQTVPWERLLPQPFTATDDPSVLGIKPIPNLQDKIDALLDKYRAETIDIDDVDFEEVDLEENVLFPDEQQNNEADNTGFC